MWFSSAIGKCCQLEKWIICHKIYQYVDNSRKILNGCKCHWKSLPRVYEEFTKSPLKCFLLLLSVTQTWWMIEHVLVCTFLSCLMIEISLQGVIVISLSLSFLNCSSKAGSRFVSILFHWNDSLKVLRTPTENLQMINKNVWGILTSPSPSCYLWL